GYRLIYRGILERPVALRLVRYNTIIRITGSAPCSVEVSEVSTRLRRVAAVVIACCAFGLLAQTPRNTKGVDLWALKPVVRPAVPAAAGKFTNPTNPIDAF